MHLPHIDLNSTTYKLCINQACANFGDIFFCFSCIFIIISKLYIVSRYTMNLSQTLYALQ